MRYVVEVLIDGVWYRDSAYGIRHNAYKRLFKLRGEGRIPRMRDRDARL